MPKIAYVEKRFRQDTLVMIELCNRIVADYQAQGFDLTLRQLYYRLVAQGLLPNKQKEYKRLGRIISDARLAGLVDWDAIVDRTRQLQENSHWQSPQEIVKAAHRGFMIDRWANQPYRVEVWVEKDALIGVVGRVCRELDVSFFSCRGYTSQSSMWRASIRLSNSSLARSTSGLYHSGQRAYVIHLADHDPSGIDMTRDVQDRFGVFGSPVEVNRVALNQDQVERYDPPPNPAKLADSRAPDYIARYGYDSWELDALEPAVIADLIRENVLSVRDDLLWEIAIEREQGMKEQLDRAVAFIESED